MAIIPVEESALEPGEFKYGHSERVLLCKTRNSYMHEKLPYPLLDVQTSTDQTIQVYDIPAEDKKDVLNKLWPFMDKPSMDAEMIDIHCDLHFIVKDFMVSYENGVNYLVSPYYALRGGTVLDWVPVKDDTGATLSPGACRVSKFKDEDKLGAFIMVRPLRKGDNQNEQENG